MAIVVSDSSPIRALAQLDSLALLHLLFDEVLVPPAVIAELEQPRSKLPPLAIRKLPFVRVQAPTDRAVVDELLLTLDLGESEALALALELRADVVLIDESAGRQVAAERGLLVLGLLGTLLRAKQRGFLETLAPLVDRLRNELGFFISDGIREEILKAAGE